MLKVFNFKIPYITEVNLTFHILIVSIMGKEYCVIFPIICIWISTRLIRNQSHITQNESCCSITVISISKFIVRIFISISIPFFV